MPWEFVPPRALADLVHRQADAHCVTELYRPARGVLLCRISGRFAGDHAMALARASTSATLGDPEIHYYSDWGLMSSYESAARSTMTDWGRHTRRALKSGTFICGQRIVEMGVNVAGVAMAVLGIRIEAVDRDAFNASLRTRLGARRPPTSVDGDAR